MSNTHLFYRKRLIRIAKHFEPLKYTKQKRKTTFAYILAYVCSLLAIGLAGIGMYLGIEHGDWWTAFLLMPFCILLIILVYLVFPKTIKTDHTIEVIVDGLFLISTNQKTEKTTEQLIPFSSIHRVLVGMFVKRAPGIRRKRPYLHDALIVIMHKDGDLFRKVSSPDELDAWIKRLDKNIPDIQYTTFDLSKAYAEQFKRSIDFSLIDGTEQDVVREHVGTETAKQTYTTWQPEKMSEEARINRIAEITQRTRIFEHITLWTLFLVNLIFFIFIIPFGERTLDALTDMPNVFILSYVLANLLLPAMAVFWRTFTRWYFIIFYILAVPSANVIGSFLMYFIKDEPVAYEFILALNMINLILWIASYILIKMIKSVTFFGSTRSLISHNIDNE